MQRNFLNKTAVVTGGGSGIGAAIARMLLKEGATVIIADVNKPDFSGEQNLYFHHCNLVNAGDCKKFFHSVLDRNGSPDCLILSAGRGIHDKLSEGDPEQWQYICDLNIVANLRMIRYFTPLMMKRKSGDIVFISSVTAKTAYPYGGVYAATKAAMDMVVETLRLELQPDIRVIKITPGVVDTPFFKSIINGSQTPENIGWGAISAEEIANILARVLALPREVTINETIIRPTAQWL